MLSSTTYTKVGDDKFFYTLDGDDVVTNKLVAGAVSEDRRTSNLTGVSSEAKISKINPLDGSAILEDENQEGLIWLHDQGDNFVQIADSEDATGLFVTVNECLLWANEGAPIPEGGVPEDALVVHEELTGGGATTIRTELNDPIGVGNVEGTYVLNSQPYTPSNAFWFLNTAEKLAPDTALLRTYRILDTAPAADSDSDGLPDSVETGSGTFIGIDTDTGTDPNNPDTDGDGLLDRYETGTGIFVTATETGTNPNMADTDGDGFLDGVETNTGIYKFYDFGDGDLAADGDNQDDARNNTGTDPNVAGDFDEDLTLDGLDSDIDNDSVLNSDDAFPFDAEEDTDTDGDGIGNNADTDDDNDGVNDVDDAFPLDPTKSTYDLRLSASAQTSSSDAQTREIRVSSNTSWVWVSSDPSWLTAAGESVEQNGSQTFEYEITQNIDDEPRSAELTFTTTTGDVQVTITVSQLGGPGAEGLAITPNTLSVGQDATTRQVQVLTQRDWRWESDVSWITSAEAVNQSGTQTFSFAVEANDTGLSRDGTFTISTIEGDLSATVLVSQSTERDDDRDGLSNDEETKPYFLITGQFTWEQARLDALRRGGTLAAITSAVELADMQDVLEAFDSNVWIGGSDEASLGVFGWVTGELFADSNWATGQPDSSFGVSGISLQPNFEWNDLNKYTKLNGYILELPATNPLDPFSEDNRVKDGELWVDSDNDGLLGITEVALGTDPRTADTDRDGLLDGEEFNPFEVVTGAFSWFDSREDAEESSASSLIVIDSEEKQVRVMSALGGSLDADLWIGGINITGIPHDEFDWLEDPFDPVVYANWAENQPNSFFGATAIKLQVDFEWDDANILEARGYLLERDQTNPLDSDSDDDGLTDGLEVKTYGTDPNEEDTDGDGLNDGPEIDAGTDPFDTDSDDDGRTDGEEVNGPIFTNPLNADSDGDGISDFDEVNGTDPSDPNDPNDPVDGGGGSFEDGDPKRDFGLQTKNLALLSTDEVKAPAVFTPFGNSVQVLKYGDDGSQVVIDNSGILLWGRDTGEGYRYVALEDSASALALDVSNAELVLWSNRYTDFTNYPDRPEAEVTLYRFNPEGELTSTVVNIAGKEVLDTPSITTTSGSRIITTTERIEGPRELNTGNVGEEEFYDALSIRVYRLTTTGDVQRLTTISDPDIAWNARNFADTQEGPGVEVLGYGSDGSQLYQYEDFLPLILKAPNPRPDDLNDFFSSSFDGRNEDRPIYYDKVLWANEDGEAQELVLDPVNQLDPDTKIERVLFMSNSRLVVEVTKEIREFVEVIDEFGFFFREKVVTGVVQEIRDYRRTNAGTGQIGTPSIISLTNANELLLDIGNLTIRGNVTYIYSTDGTMLRSYKLTDSGASKVGEIDVEVGVSDVAKINPSDGSAIIESEDTGTNLLWVFPNADEPSDETLRFIELEDSGQASALFVTNDELVIWNNAYAPIPFGSGVPETADVQHLVRSDSGYNDDIANNDPTSGPYNFTEIERTQLPTEGIYVLNSPRAVLPTNLWRFITAEKLPNPGDTALLRTYKLESLPNLDSDSDGILDKYETGGELYTDSQSTGTDPINNDSDGDGLSDGDEVYTYYLVEGEFSYQAAVEDAERRAADGNVYAHLAVINSQRVLNELKARFGNAIDSEYWIGLDDLGVEGEFAWVDNARLVDFGNTPGIPETFDENIFNNWATNQPDNADGADAVVMRSDYTWRTRPAGESRGYILQVQRTNPNDPDTDGDGLSDSDEVKSTLTDPNNQDTDGDDGAVVTYVVDGQLLGTAILNANDSEDLDPLIAYVPGAVDTDGDGLDDAVETLITGTLVDNPDSDGDGLLDGVETGIGPNVGNFVDKNNTGTDPNNPDSDGDGVDDGDEIFNSSDPNKDSYRIADGELVSPYQGWYSGLVLRESDNKPVGLMSVKVSKVPSDSGPTYYLSGKIYTFNQPDRPFTGRFLSNGRAVEVTGVPADLAFTIFKWRRIIGGKLTSEDGSLQRFNLSKAYYNNKRNTNWPLRGNYTYLIPSTTTNSLAAPAGDGIGYGSINAVGKTTIKGWTNAGYKFTQSRSLRFGNWTRVVGSIPFYTRSYKPGNGSEWMAGTINYDGNMTPVEVESRIRYTKPSDNSLYYPAGYDQDVVIEGSRYRRSAYNGIPAEGFDLFANNAQGLFDGSLPDNSEFAPYIFSWEADGDMIAPLNFTYFTESKYDEKLGIYTGIYIDQTIVQNSTIRGVVMQKQGLVSGHADSSDFGVTVRHGIIPNDTGEVAPSASIIPTSKDFDNDFLGQSLGGVYQVNIEISPNSVIQNWTVDIPAEFDWVTADVLSGSGTGVITITVAENRTLFNREAVIQIGGLNHRITQERRISN
ncbi:MAG: BACON domain-containing protein [Akkermansiaceae bacterium]